MERMVAERDPELPQSSWELPVKRCHHQKLVHRESTHMYVCEVDKVNGSDLFFPSPNYMEGQTCSSSKAEEFTTL